MDPMEQWQHHTAKAREIHDEHVGKAMPRDAADQMEAHLKLANEVKARLSEPQYKHDMGAGDGVRSGDGSMLIEGKDGILNPEQWAEAVAAKMRKVAQAAGTKAVVTGSLTVPSVLTDYAPFPQEATSLLELIGRKTITEVNYGFLRQTVRTNNAGPVADEALKPTNTFTMDEIEGKAEVVAHLSEPFPQRFLTDHDEVVRILRSEMAAGVITAIEDQVVNGSGVAPEFEGILTVSGTTPVAWATDEMTTLRKARTALQLKGEKPTAYALHPSDIELLDLKRADGTTGQYLELEDRIYGNLPVVPSLSVAAGTGLLADWMTLRLYVRQGMTLDSDSSGTLFDKNQVKLRAEARANVAALRPQAIAVIDLTSV